MKINSLCSGPFMYCTFITQRDDTPSNIILQTLRAADDHCTLAISFLQYFPDNAPRLWSAGHHLKAGRRRCGFGVSFLND